MNTFMNTLKLNAYAKINLGLDVVRKRPDGYHEVQMVMQTINLYDRLMIKILSEDKIILKTNLPYLPCDESNLVCKAIQLVKDKHQIKAGVHVLLDKHIPVAAGMAGGSSDCAAALVGMNRLFRLKLSKQELMKYGVALGADVPYCILRGTALSQGIGEILTPLPPAPQCHVLIAKPPVHVSTKFVYENLQLDKIQKRPDIDGIVSAIKAGSLASMAGSMANVLETVTIPAYPAIGTLKEIMLGSGAICSLMSGSGPTVFGLFEKEQDARKAYGLCKKENLSNVVYLTNFFLPARRYARPAPATFPQN